MQTPPIGQGIPKTFAPNSPEFDKRVKDRFPVGSDERNLIAELESEKFTIETNSDESNLYRHSAKFNSHDVACGESWVIEWNANGGKISDVGGRYRQSCF